MRFTVDTLDNGEFLDIRVLNNSAAGIYMKDANTGLYVQYHSMNIRKQKLLGYAHCMIEYRKSAATNSDLWRKQFTWKQLYHAVNILILLGIYYKVATV